MGITKMVMKIFCNILGWHKYWDMKFRWFDGCSVRATCPWCDKECMKDSQGNWF